MAGRSYYIMSGDTVVAKWENGGLEVCDKSLLPLYLERVPNADLWLETRAIDVHRTNSRLLKKALRLKERDDRSTVLHVNAATITDNYWVKPPSSGLKYSDVRFRTTILPGSRSRGTMQASTGPPMQKTPIPPSSRTPAALKNAGG